MRPPPARNRTFSFHAAVAGISLLAALPAISPRPAFGLPDAVHHALAVTLFPDEGRIAVADTITVTPAELVVPPISLPPNARITGVAVNGKEAPYAWSDGVLKIQALGIRVERKKGPRRTRGGLTVPGKDRSKGESPFDEKTVTVLSYEATFRDAPPADPVRHEDPTFGVAATVSPQGTFLGADARWHPDVKADQVTFRLRIEAPEGIEAVTAGKRLSRSTAGGKTVSTWEVSRPVRGLALSAGRYVVRDRPVDNVMLSTYFLPGNDPLSGKYLDAAERYLRLYIELLGPYPFEKFAVAENFFPTGYGFPSWTLLGSTVIALPFIADTSLGHEIAHSWWGNGVFVDPRGGNWSEGLTTYVADHLYKERISPEEGREERLKMLRDYASLVPPGAGMPLAQFTGRVSPATRAVGYGKGMFVFHMARKEVGDEAFWEGLRTVVREKLFRPAGWDDFARGIGKAAGRDMLPFFRKWLESADGPSLSLSGVRSERTGGGGWKVTGRVTQGAPFFPLRVPLRLETSGKPVEIALPLPGEAAPFEIETGEAPSALLLDPDVDLFRRLAPSEVPPAVNGIRGSGDLAVVVARGMAEETAAAASFLLSAMGRDGHLPLREEDTPPGALAGRDVLYLGVPSGVGFLPGTLPKGLSLAPTRFTLNGTTYGAPGDALFAAFPHPSDPARVAAVFLPLSPAAANAAGRKIPHYGKYSYLVFSGGNLREKGTWPPVSSPAVHRFEGTGWK